MMKRVVVALSFAMLLGSPAHATGTHTGVPGTANECNARGLSYASRACPAGDVAGRNGNVLDLSRAAPNGPLYVVTGQIVKLGNFRSFGKNATYAPGLGDWVEHDEARLDGSDWTGVYYVGTDCSNYMLESNPFMVRYRTTSGTFKRAIVKVPPQYCRAEK